MIRRRSGQQEFNIYSLFFPVKPPFNSGHPSHVRLPEGNLMINNADIIYI